MDRYYALDLVFKSGLVKTVIVMGWEIAEQIRDDFKKEIRGVSSYQEGMVNIKHSELAAVVIIQKSERGQDDGQ